MKAFARKTVAFSVGIAVGCAPLLGKVKVPGFDALLTLIPAELQPTMIPLSGFLMGIIAVAVQFYADRPEPQRLWRRAFGALVMLELAAFFAFATMDLLGDTVTRYERLALALLYLALLAGFGALVGMALAPRAR